LAQKDCHVISYMEDKHEITTEHFEKLKKLYDLHSSSIDPTHIHFHGRLYCLIRRYKTMFGIDGTGFQAAAPAPIWQAIIKECHVRHESFASPLNCYLPFHCSAYFDTDGYFGSSGSFFDFEPTEGNFQLGTPNVEEVMIKASHRVNQFIKSATGPMTWVCLVPDWNDPPAEFLSVYGNSPYLRKKILIDGNSYAYIRGDQETKVETSEFFFIAPFSNWVFLLQNDEAAKTLVIDDAVVERIKQGYKNSTKLTTKHRF